MSTALALPLLRRPRVELAPLLLILALFALPSLPEPVRGNASALLVQPNISDDQIWNPATFESTMQQLELLSVLPDRGAAQQPDLLVWPEAPSAVLREDSRDGSSRPPRRTERPDVISSPA